MMTGIAVVGAGHWGPHLIRNFNDHLSSQMLWIIEVNSERRRKVGQRFPKVATSDTLEDALTDDRVDGVVVATPTSTHMAIIRDCLTAGKHVLAEKPIATSLSDAISLCELADSVDRVLMVGHVFLFNPAYVSVKSYIDSEHLGRLSYLSMVRTNLGPVREDVNAAWDLASHDISIANYWLDSPPHTVSAAGGSWINDGIEDVVFATLEYQDHVLVHIEASWLHPTKRRLVSVVGSERMLTVDDMELNEPIRIFNKGVVAAEHEVKDTFAGFRSQIRQGEVVIPHVDVGEPLKAECEEFVERIRGGGTAISNGWDGARVVAVLDAIDRSITDAGAAVEVKWI